MRWLSLARATRSVLWRLARRTRMNIVCAAPNSSELAGPGKYSLARIRPHASDADRDLAEEAMRMAGEPTGLVSARLAHGDELIGWQSEGRIVSFCWISYHERSVGPVRLADTPGRVFLYNAFTLKEHRGRRLFAALLLAARSSLGREGATELVCDVDVRNTPSARSLEKAGFVPVGRLAFLTLFNRWRWPLERTVSSDSGRQIFCPR